MLVAAVVLVAAARHVGDVTASERAFFDLFNTLPGGLAPMFRALYRLGALWAVGLVVVAALVARRWHLARDLLAAGLLAWAAARVIGLVVVAHEGIVHSVRIATGAGGSPAFPSVRVAVVVAVIAAASPYVTRPTRVVGWLLVAALAAATLYLGAAFPVDVVAGVVLGWGVGAVVHLAFGSPGLRPSVPEVVEALRELGVDARDARLDDGRPSSSTILMAADDEGPLRIKVIGRDEAQSRLLSKVWRTIFYKDSGPRSALSRVEQVEHEAFLLLVAAQAGADVPRVVAAGRAGPRAAALVQRPVSGTRLSELDASAVDDDLLARIWRNVAALHRARVAHNALDPAHVIIADHRPWIVGFDSAVAAGGVERTAHDVAELLAGTAAIVGVERAVAAAAGVLEAGALAAALPFLQPAALTSLTRDLGGERRRALLERLDRVRAAGADAVGIEPPELTRLHRISPTGAAMALGALVAIGTLLLDVGDPSEVWATIHGADWSWIALAVVLSLVSNVAYAIGLQGAVPIRLLLWPTTEVELGMSFSNLAVPAIGGQAMQVRYLQKVGVDLSSAVAAGGILSNVGVLVASLALFAVALAFDPGRVDLSLIPTDGLLVFLLAVLAFAALVSAVVAGVPKVRALLVPPITRAVVTMWTTVRSPQRLALLLGGNALAILLSTWCLQACLIAFGGHTSFWALLAANVAVLGIASTVPIPGGGTAVGTIGLSAALVSFGVSREVTIATALADQLIFFYLPAIPGWFATRHLVRHDYL